MNWTNLKDIIKRELRYLPMWYVLASSLQLCYQMISNWHIEGVPEHSFDTLGIGAVMTVIFPILWVVIFAFCRSIATRNQQIKDLEEKQKREGGNP